MLKSGNELFRKKPFLAILNKEKKGKKNCTNSPMRLRFLNMENLKVLFKMLQLKFLT